ncbi:hypothetical protein HY969_00245 [Candidatus Kaiserbacteria bacterium]|nr:hypothetical protein [Candidatus Kaiserbacteria bacterium]
MGWGETTVEQDFAALSKLIDGLEPENVRAEKTKLENELEKLRVKLRTIIREKIGFKN